MWRVISTVLASAALAQASDGIVDGIIKIPKMYLFNFAEGDEGTKSSTGKKESIIKVPPTEDVKTITLVVACGNESYAAESLSHLLGASQPSNVKQIIVVDDGSPDNHITQHLSEAPYVDDKRLTLISHFLPVGTVAAQALAARQATEDVLVMLPCVSTTSDLWHLDVLKQINSNYKRVVAPSFQKLDIRRWRGTGEFQLGSKFPRLDGMLRHYPVDVSDKEPEVPVHLGSFAVSRQFFNETGGWDSRLAQRGYGADLDFSLRTWLCGGELRGSRLFGLAVPEAQSSDHDEYSGVRIAVGNWFGSSFLWKVGGLAKWRADDKPRDERRHYGKLLPIGDDAKNEYDGSYLGQMTHMSRVHDQCKPFSWFLNRFEIAYQAGGLMPTSVSHMKDHASGLCLEWRPLALTPDVVTSNMMTSSTITDSKGHSRSNITFNGDLVLRPCSPMAPQQMFHKTNLRHAAGSARVHDSSCCSGITVWDQDACITTDSTSGSMKTSSCVVDGSNHDQFAVFVDNMIQVAGNQCLKAVEEAIQLVPMQCGFYSDESDQPNGSFGTIQLSQKTDQSSNLALNKHRRYAAPLTVFLEHDDLGLQHLDTGLCLKKFMRNDTNSKGNRGRSNMAEEDINRGYEDGGEFILALADCVGLKNYGDSDADYSLAHVQSLLGRGSYASRKDLAKYVFKSFESDAKSHCVHDGTTYELYEGQLRSRYGQCLGLEPNMFYKSDAYNAGSALGLDTCGFYKDGDDKVARAGQFFQLEKSETNENVVTIRDPHAEKCIFQNRRNGRLAFEPCDVEPEAGYMWLIDPRDKFFKYTYTIFKHPTRPKIVKLNT